ncbi:hypothetical protein ZWY2020_058486 [Hordeum vulgare]|nr:hypothetical protein ZWY2020_058486 [Hordeum vulgare]
MAPARAAKHPKLEPPSASTSATASASRRRLPSSAARPASTWLQQFRKSSFVCAIALALAADPSILGRSSSVGAFVKRGEESDHVRLSLRSQAQASDIHITGKIDTNNKSEWLLDGLYYV